jgi:ferredoxin-thioredoxin reductase catalytic subunit
MKKEELKEFCKKYADSQGFELQPDKVILDQILIGLLNREKTFGFRYCPCRRVTGDPDEDKKIICPCVYHKDEVKDDGHCKCLLFFESF